MFRPWCHPRREICWSKWGRERELRVVTSEKSHWKTGRRRHRCRGSEEPSVLCLDWLGETETTRRDRTDCRKEREGWSEDSGCEGRECRVSAAEHGKLRAEQGELFSGDEERKWRIGTHAAEFKLRGDGGRDGGRGRNGRYQRDSLYVRRVRWDIMGISRTGEENCKVWTPSVCLFIKKTRKL